MNEAWLPLFPLQVVLLPGMPLPLHIFEPRYRLMMGTCRERQKEFGVVLARPGGEARKAAYAEVGCSAAIARILREFPDGRLDLVAMGHQRFRIRTVSDALPYLQAEVEVLEEEEAPEEPPQAGGLWPLFLEAYRLASGESGEPELPAEYPAFSFFVAATLPLELEVRQQVLEGESESARRRLLEAQLLASLPRLRRIARRRQKAAGNGHG